MLSIGLFLSLVSMSLAIDLPGISNNTQCVFMPSTKLFTCSFGDHKVECPAVANFSVFDPTTYHIFGIGKLDAKFVDTPVEKVYYSLYPRAFDNTTYVSTTVGSNIVNLYYGENFVYYGIRVIDLTCFKHIFDLFGGITDYHVVNVGATPVSLIGEVLYSDSTVQKRWLLGYGFGMGFPYYGWGGLGLGMGGLGMGLGFPGLWWG